MSEGCKDPNHRGREKELGCIGPNSLRERWCVLHAMNHFDAFEHSRMMNNDTKKNGHQARVCPERIDVQVYGDRGLPHYIHGDCMPPHYDHHLSLPTISTEGGVVSFTVMNGPYQEVTYSGLLVSAEFDLAFAANGEVRVKLGDISREVRKVHTDPHYVEIEKHGKFCICKCEQCTFEDGDGNTLCNDGECDC